MADDTKLIREGDPAGSPSVVFDPERRANYHLDRNGERVYHGVPAGFEFNDEGELEPLPELGPIDPAEPPVPEPGPAAVFAEVSPAGAGSRAAPAPDFSLPPLTADPSAPPAPILTEETTHE